MDTRSEILHSGWLIKSPPERKMNRGFFKAQWKRRYFVLQESLSSHLPGQNATLVYYKDEKRKDKKGTIDLEHCEEVLSSLDSPIYPYLFGIKTLHKKGTSRTYYLAAHNEVDMIKWVDGLCTVLGLKENNDSTSPLLSLGASVGNENMSMTPPMKGSCSSVSSKSPEIGPKYPKYSEDVHRGIGNSDVAKEEYIPLESCYSGEISKEDEPILSSIPMDFAPPPPVKTHTAQSIFLNTNEETYDCPSKSYKPEIPDVDGNDNLYKLPPSYHASVLDTAPPGESGGSIYKYPPSKNRLSTDDCDVFSMVPPPRSTKFIDNSEDIHDYYQTSRQRFNQSDYELQSNKMKKKLHSPDKTCQGSNHVEDWPTQDKNVEALPQNMNNLSITDASEEIYDMPSNKSSMLDFVPPPPPPHPHKVIVDPNSDSRYINLPLNSKSHPNQSCTTENSYDFPLSMTTTRKQSDAEILGMSPPPPSDNHKTPIIFHRYTNAPPGYIPTENSSGDNSYMPMSSAGGSSDSYVPMEMSAQVDSYLPMNKQRPLNDTEDSQTRDIQDTFESTETCTYVDNRKENQNPAVSSMFVKNSDKASSATYSLITENDSISDIYSSPSSNRPVSEDLYYAPPPNNRPIEQISLKRTDISSTAVSNNPITTAVLNNPVTQSLILDSAMEVPPFVQKQTDMEDNTYDTPPPRPSQFKKVSNSSPRFKSKDRVPVPSFNIDRSRSFKRNISPTKTDVPLPKRKSQSEDSSSSEDDDALSETKSTSSHDQSVENKPPKVQMQVKALKRSLHSTPPPPKKSGEIQYLELDLDPETKHEKEVSDAEKSPTCSKSPGKTAISPTTDYREIDFVKTDALSATKREVENKRKSSEKSVDE